MKQTFTNKYLDWTLVVITALFFVDAVVNLILAFHFFSTYLLRIAFAASALAAFISLLAKNANGEKYAKFFILVSLLFPFVFVFYQFLTTWLFYGPKRWDLWNAPGLYMKFLGGMVLLLLAIKYSRRKQNLTDYGDLIIYIGTFLVLLILISTVEPHFNDVLNKIALWEAITKSIMGVLVIYLGHLLKNKKITLKKCTILTIILMSVYGLI